MTQRRLSPFRALLRFLRCERAAIAIEFGIILVPLLIVFAGIFELSRLVLVHMKLDKLVLAAGDFAANNESSCINAVGVGVNPAEIMSPYPWSGSVNYASFGNGIIGPSCVAGNAATVCVYWNTGIPGQNNISGGAITFNEMQPFTPTANQTYLAAQVRYNYTPLLGDIAGVVGAFRPHEIIKSALHKPRRGAMTQLGGC